MYFDDLLSKIIGYIEDVRYDAMKDKILIGGNFSNYSIIEQMDAKIDINLFFANNILSYIDLFFKYYYKCKYRDGLSRSQKTADSLENTKNAFKYMRQNAKMIINNPKDFNIQIKSSSNDK